MVNKRTTYWGWIATPAAAVVGVVFGLSIPGIINETEKGIHIAQTYDTIRIPQYTHDTILVPNTTHDTVYLTKVEERERIVWRDRPQQKMASTTDATTTSQQPSHLQPQMPMQCTSVACDGINYSMLVTR